MNLYSNYINEKVVHTNYLKKSVYVYYVKKEVVYANYLKSAYVYYIKKVNYEAHVNYLMKEGLCINYIKVGEYLKENL